LKLWLAPLHGITHYNFRNCFIKHFRGIDCVITPFIAAQPKSKFNAKKSIDLFPENNKLMPTIPQLMGNKADEIKETIVALKETFGYEHFNWNIGCPMNQIVRKKRGCGLMPFPDLVEEVVNEVCYKTTIRFSLKMRLGLHSPKECLEIIRRIAPYPIDFLCIHPRLGSQQYEGNVDLDTFENCYHITNHTIVYSGDINNIDFFKQLQKRFPKIENWMLGRGILQNPFLAEEILGNYQVETYGPPETYGSTSLQQIHQSRFTNFYNEYSETLLMLKNENTILGVLKELWHYFAVFFKLDDSELRKLLQINDYQIFHKSTQKIMYD
jgi:tRNA-dihydrouridine synthase